MLVVVHPAIGAVLAAKAILDGAPALFEQACHLALDPWQILGMDVPAPEVRIFEIFARRVAKQALDIVADEGRGEIALGVERIDHRGGGIEQPRQPNLGRGRDRRYMLALPFFVLTRRVGQNTLDYVCHILGIGAGRQHFTKRRGSNLGVFSV